MIKIYMKLLIILGIQLQVFSHSTNIEKRIKALRHKFKKEIKDIQLMAKQEETQDFIENYDLIAAESTEMTVAKSSPRSQHRLHHRPHKHRSSTDTEATTTTNEPATNTTVDNIPLTTTISVNKTIGNFDTDVKELEEKVEAAIKNLTNYLNKVNTETVEEQISTATRNPDKLNLKKKPLYRRFNFQSDVERNKPQKWVHCLSLISPRLEGIKDDVLPTVITHNHGDVKRLSQLLYTDVSNFNEQDIVSVLSQISKIRIRLYQWDQLAITTMFNVIIKEPTHSFKTLKAGIKRLFDNWHLDTSMLTVFLEQTRIFRPPCIKISDYSGYTRKPGGPFLYTKPDKPKKKKHYHNESCHSREEHKFNNDP